MAMLTGQTVRFDRNSAQIETPAEVLEPVEIIEPEIQPEILSVIPSEKPVQEIAKVTEKELLQKNLQHCTKSSKNSRH